MLPHRPRRHGPGPIACPGELTASSARYSRARALAQSPRARRCHKGGSDFKNEHEGPYSPDALQTMMYQHIKYHSYDNNDRCRQGNGCRYNEVVLDAAAWADSLPGVIEAVFVPKAGGATAEANARRIHAALLREYRLPAEAVPLVTLDLASSTTPFATLPVKPMPALAPDAAPAPEPEPMPAVCEAVFSPESKFWRLWGTRETWRQSAAGERQCWEQLGGDAYFERAGKAPPLPPNSPLPHTPPPPPHTPRWQAMQCDVNWFEGAQGELGRVESRAHFAAPAPALLGFDGDLYRVCSAAVGKKTWWESGKDGDFNNEIAHRCVGASRNILRLLTGRPGWGWTMCQNLQWQVCAAKGKLPGQRSQGALEFATAPPSLMLFEWREPESYPCDGGKKCAGRYTVGDVFFAEACLFVRLCKNGRAVFDGAAADCDFDEAGFAEFKGELKARTRNLVRE